VTTNDETTNDETTTDETTDPETTTDETGDVETTTDVATTGRRARVFAFGVLPALALLLAIGAGVLKWQTGVAATKAEAGQESVQAARDIATVMLTYEPDKIEEQLVAARDLLTGPFRESYTTMINDVVIPGAKNQRITAITNIPGAASISADAHHAQVMLYVDQKVTIGDGAPTNNLSTVRVTLDKVGDRWLMSNFEPV
jgi:Mce-associated membrane protein